MGGNVDTLLMQKDRPEWSTGAKGSRFAYIAKDYRVLLMFGDLIGDFSDKYNARPSRVRQTIREAESPFWPRLDDARESGLWLL